MTAKLRTTIQHDRTVTAEEVAKLFCDLDNFEQAAFFNTVAKVTDAWVGASFCFQLQGVIDSAKLNAAGISIMEQIGEYAKALKEDLQKYAKDGSQ